MSQMLEDGEVEGDESDHVKATTPIETKLSVSSRSSAGSLNSRLYPRSPSQTPSTQLDVDSRMLTAVQLRKVRAFEEKHGLTVHGSQKRPFVIDNEDSVSFVIPQDRGAT
jgi:hypothetical protein